MLSGQLGQTFAMDSGVDCIVEGCGMEVRPQHCRETQSSSPDSVHESKLASR